MSTVPRVTELSNPLTIGLSDASPDAFLRMLAACDAQLFTGSHGLPCAHEFAPQLARASKMIAAALAHPRGHVVFGGCGTSGRLAHLLAAVYNDAARGLAGRFHYLLAGGDPALLIPAESVEDSAQAGAGDYAAWEARCGVGPEDPVVLVGISCGLSATFVASLLAAGASRPSVFPVALGFNDVAAVRAVAVPGEGVTFHGVLQALTAAAPARALVVNPVVGPEAVAGSSRMKGGSATWILLATACEEAVSAARGGAAPSAASIRRRLLRAEGAVRALYSGADGGLAALVRAGAAALAAQRVPAAAAAGSGSGSSDPYAPAPAATGRIFYVGAGAAGLLGLVDASEATDTYGSAFGDLRGFLARGWAAAAVAAGACDPEVPLELRGRGPGGAPPPRGAARASPCLSSFLRDVAPTLAGEDVVVALWAGGGCAGAPGDDEDGASDGFQLDSASDGFQLLRALSVARSRGAAALAVVVEGAPLGARERELTDALLASASAPGGGLRVPLWELAPPPEGAACSDAAPWAPLLALKLALNALSTGAHVLGRGVVLGNRMGNMMLTNHKLYLRAAGIVGEEARVPPRAAAAALLRAVHGWPAGSPELEAALAEEAREGSTTVLRHVAAAAVMERVIPTALLLAAAEREGRPLAAAEARAALEREPRVRLAARALGLTSVGAA
jgi:N-acetylmuramic acid 6-phosphate (MurNAc-6-P) etherase